MDKCEAQTLITLRLWEETQILMMGFATAQLMLISNISSSSLSLQGASITVHIPPRLVSHELSNAIIFIFIQFISKFPFDTSVLFNKHLLIFLLYAYECSAC